VSAPQIGIALALESVSRELQLTTFASRIDELGFDYLTCGDHISFHAETPNAFITLAVCAGVTKRVHLVSAIVLLPLYPPAVVAKMTAMLDFLSGGRFELGVGVGGEFAPEFELVGVPLSNRGRRADESLAVIAALLEQESVDFEGEFNHFHGARLEPRPVRQPRPPIWVGGRKAAAIRRAARFGDVWMPYMFSPEQFARSTMEVRTRAGELGRNPESIKSAMYCYVGVHPDSQKARKDALQVLGGLYQQDFEPIAERYVITGSAAECRTRLQEFADAGADILIVSFACPPAESSAMLERFAADVAPAIRSGGKATV
jgi:probable F420-dependent oxidoreductase